MGSAMAATDTIRPSMLARDAAKPQAATAAARLAAGAFGH